MKFDLKTPCNNCPFRTDVKFPLTQERVEGIVEAITDGDQTFACHKTTSHDDEGHYCPSEREQHCAGALIMLERMNQPNQFMRIAERLGMYDRHKLRMDAPVFRDGDDMIAADHWCDRRTGRPQHKPAKPAITASPFGTARKV